MMVAMILAVTVSAAYAGNVDTYGIGSKATALGGAFTAYSDDPYAAYYNPAGLTQIDRLVISGGLHIIDPTLDVSDFHVSNTADPQISGYKDFSDESPNLFAPHLGAAMPIGDKLAIGIAAYAPWGLEIEWNDNPVENPGAYNCFHSYYVREAVTPTVAYKINDKFSFGFGLSLGKSIAGEERKLYVSPDIGNDPVLGPAVYEGTVAKVNGAVSPYLPAGASLTTAGTAALTQQVMTGAAATAATEADRQTYTAYAAACTQLIAANPGASAADASALLGNATRNKFNGVPATDHGAHTEAELEDSFNYSFNIGLMYKPGETLTLGLTYRSKTAAEFEGDVEKNGVKVAEAALDYDHPDQIQFGIRYVPESNKNLSFEFDLVWTHWSINDVQSALIDPNLPVEIMPGVEPNKLTESTFRRDWEDTKQIRFGVEWKINEMFTLRSGYFYDPSPIPDDTLDLIWTDADKKTYSVGCGMNFGNFSVDTVFQYIDVEKARYLGGESEGFNHSYEGSGISKEVSMSADAHLLGAGLTLNYKF